MTTPNPARVEAPEDGVEFCDYGREQLNRLSAALAPASGVDAVAIAAIILKAMEDLRVDIHFDIEGKEQAAD